MNKIKVWAGKLYKWLEGKDDPLPWWAGGDLYYETDSDLKEGIDNDILSPYVCVYKKSCWFVRTK